MKSLRHIFGSDFYIGLAQNLVFHYKIFKETYELLNKSQWWPQNQLEEYQLEQLEKLLIHTYENVPYYRKIFNKKGLKPKHIKNIRDLQNLPYLTKQIVKENINYLKAKNFPEYKFEFETTGGTTGTPFGFYIEYGTDVAESLAYFKIQLEWGNCNFRDRMVMLTSFEKPWSYHLFFRFLNLSCFFMTDNNLKFYLDRIRKFKPKYIYAYPEPLSMIAKYMDLNRIKISLNLKAIFCSGETLHDWQRELIEKTFKCRVFNIYGHKERAVLSCSCETSNYLHIFSELGIVELIDRNGNPVTKEGEMGEIVATGLTKYIFPFIRYKTGDIGVYTSKKCSCGRNYPLIKKIEGRIQDFIIAKDGTLIPSMLSIFATRDKEWMKFKQIQFLQEKPGELIIKIIKESGYNNIEIEQFVMKIFNKIFHNQFKLQVVFVDHIPLAKSGKYQYLIQRLPVNFSP